MTIPNIKHFQKAEALRGEVALSPIRPRVRISAWISYVFATYTALAVIQFLVFNQNWRWEVVRSYLFSQLVMEGLLRTLQLTFFTTLLGLALGVVTALCRLSSLTVLRNLALIYIWVMRAMPPLVMLLLVFFFGALAPKISLGLPFGPSLASVDSNEVITRFSAAVVGLAIYLGAYIGEILRGGVMALPAGQIEACKSLGIAPGKAYLHILGPQLVRVSTPALANEIITVFKATSLVSVIGYAELLTTVQTIYSRNFQTIPLLAVAVIWYLVLTSIAMVAQSRLERRFGRGFTRRAMEKAVVDTNERAGGLA